MPGQKLDDDWAHPLPAVAAAYEVCLGVEKELILQQTPTLTATETKALEKKLINIQDLDRKKMKVPTHSSVGECFMISCSSAPAKGCTPQVSHHSRLTYRVTLADVARTIEKYPANHSEARKSMYGVWHHRPGFLDWMEYEELQFPEGLAGKTEYAHIFSESTNAGMEDKAKRAYAENAWTIIREFGYQDVYNELGGTETDVHRLQNVMTLRAGLHDLFDKLALWFEATGTHNSYKVCSSFRRFHTTMGVPEYVKFTTERQDLPLPSPRYLEIHAARCRVAHMSGAADYYRDLDDDDPFVTKLRSFNPVGSDFSAALHARLPDLGERRAEATVPG